MRTLTLVIQVVDGVDPEDVVDDVNCAILCALEDDKKTISGWEWTWDDEEQER